MTDVVYVVGNGTSWLDNELRYSLRSLDTFIDDIGTVYIVGNKPKFINGVVHLPYPDRFACKQKNIMMKVAYACGHPNISTQFLYVHDDHFAIAHARAGETPYWRGGPLSRMAKQVKPRNHWRNSVINTSDALEARGFTSYNFDIHHPMLIDKNLFPDIMDQYDWTGADHGFVVKSLYANTLGVPAVVATDLKITQRLPFTGIIEKLKGRPWFSIGNGGLTGDFKKLLAELYPVPSRFELIQ